MSQPDVPAEQQPAQTDAQPPQTARPQRHPLHAFAPAFWLAAADVADATAALSLDGDGTQPSDPTKPHISYPRAPGATGSDSDSDSSSDGSEGDEDEEEQSAQNDERTAVQRAAAANATDAATQQAADSPRLEFRHPTEPSYILVYRALLPAVASPRFLAHSVRRPHAVAMAASGHFVLAVWDAYGRLARHKTFHRYTTRRKQGGSQAAADASRGAANRIRSAGATLRRHGEHALQSDARALLRDYAPDLRECAAVFVRAGRRDRQTLLLYDDSPLAELAKDGRVRTVPFPTRRPTLKEATRVYDELTSVLVSPHSLLPKRVDPPPGAEEGLAQEDGPAEPALKETQAEQPPAPETKGTDHLKKRVEKPRAEPEPEPEPAPERDEARDALLEAVVRGKRDELDAMLAADDQAALTVFRADEVADTPALKNVDASPGLGLVAVAAAAGQPELIPHLLSCGADPTLGASPYLVTKGKAARTALRTFWGLHPERYDYAAAGIPAPLSAAAVEEVAERERAKRKKERAKRKEKEKEKAQQKLEASKTPAQRARELRAAAAEARLLGNKCAMCKKDLAGVTAFERLSYKYCSTECVAKHRAALNTM